MNVFLLQSGEGRFLCYFFSILLLVVFSHKNMDLKIPGININIILTSDSGIIKML